MTRAWDFMTVFSLITGRGGTRLRDADCPLNQESIMKRFFVATAILTLAMSSPVLAKGCIKGAIVGGVAASTVGHGKLGAATGCVV